MNTIYQIRDGLWTGETHELASLAQGIPANWTDIPPPTVGDDQAAYYVAGAWLVGTPRVETIPPVVLPDEVAIHRVKKAALLTPWVGFDNLLDAIYDGIDQLPAPKNKLAKIEFDNAPNLVRVGLTTAVVCEVLGMSIEQLNDLLVFANTLP